MTPSGFRVFKGAASWRHGAADFTPMRAAKLDKSRFLALSAMERASRFGSATSRRATAALETPFARPSMAAKPRVVGAAVFAAEISTVARALP
jgi:hypothetical protein